MVIFWKKKKTDGNGRDLFQEVNASLAESTLDFIPSNYSVAENQEELIVEEIVEIDQDLQKLDNQNSVSGLDSHMTTTKKGFRSSRFLRVFYQQISLNSNHSFMF